MFRGAVLAACAVALVSCASPYQENGFIGGYNVKDLGQDVYRISYSGNGYTTPETAQVYWLARAADLTLEKGFASFEILSDMRFSLWQPRHDDGLAPVRLAATSAIAAVAAVAVLPDELADASAWRTSGPGAAGDRPAGRIRVAASTFVFIPSGGGGRPIPPRRATFISSTGRSSRRRRKCSMRGPCRRRCNRSSRPMKNARSATFARTCTNISCPRAS